jgi:hypothetical protein
MLLKQPNYRQQKKQREDARKKRNESKKSRKEQPSRTPAQLPPV